MDLLLLLFHHVQSMGQSKNQFVAAIYVTCSYLFLCSIWQCLTALHLTILFFFWGGALQVKALGPKNTLWINSRGWRPFGEKPSSIPWICQSIWNSASCICSNIWVVSWGFFKTVHVFCILLHQCFIMVLQLCHIVSCCIMLHHVVASCCTCCTYVILNVPASDLSIS